MLPRRPTFRYTFDNITAQIEELLLTTLGLKKFSIYVQDYGAPVGFRIASRHPEAIEGIVVQNGNAYVEGISAAFEPLKPFWANRNEETEKGAAYAADQGDDDLPVHAWRKKRRWR